MSQPGVSHGLLALGPRYVTPGSRYLKLLHGNFLRMEEPERGVFVRSLIAAARQVIAEEISTLLCGGWREQLTGAVLAGLNRCTPLRDRLGELLLDSQTCYAGQGYCFALASFGTHEDAEILELYLEHWLAQPDCQYDQPWALGALLHLDTELGSDHAARFLRQDGPWQRWLDGFPGLTLDPQHYQRLIHQLCTIADEAAQDHASS